MAAAARYDEPKRLKFAFGSSLRSLSYFSEQSGFFKDLKKSHVSDQNMRAFLKAQNKNKILPLILGLVSLHQLLFKR